MADSSPTKHDGSIGVEKAGEIGIPGDEEETLSMPADEACDHPAFEESTHAWAVFGNRYDPNTTLLDRIIGTLVICFQIGCYSITIADVTDSLAKDVVPVEISFQECRNISRFLDQNPYDYQYSDELSAFSFSSSLQCEASEQNKRGVFFSMTMIAFFLTADFKDAIRAMTLTSGFSRLFAILAFLEVLTAYATSVYSAAQQLFIGQTVDAIESSVSLLFIHEVGGRVFVALRGRKGREYMSFFLTFTPLLIVGLLVGFFFAFASYEYV